MVCEHPRSFDSDVEKHAEKKKMYKAETTYMHCVLLQQSVILYGV